MYGTKKLRGKYPKSLPLTTFQQRWKQQGRPTLCHTNCLMQGRVNGGMSLKCPCQLTILIYFQIITIITIMKLDYICDNSVQIIGCILSTNLTSCNNELLTIYLNLSLMSKPDAMVAKHNSLIWYEIIIERNQTQMETHAYSSGFNSLGFNMKTIMLKLSNVI